jgi:malonyl-ACP O-methyltransferase BioC
MNIDKQQIRQRFHRAAYSYDKQATIQKLVAEKLLALLDSSGCKQPETVLEIGSCTGLLTMEIATHFNSMKQLYINDLVAEFQQPIQKKLQDKIKSFTFLPGDIESIDLPGSFDLIISSSTFHWFHNLELFFQKISRHVLPNGYLAFAMYGPKNLQEIRQLTGLGLDYPDLEQLETMVSKLFQVIICEEKTEIFTFQNPLLLLNHLRETGVNSLNRSTWTLKQLGNFSKNYKEHFTTENGVLLTYHPMYCIAKMTHRL